MSVLMNQIGQEPSTAGSHGVSTTGFYDGRAIELVIKLERISDEERLYGALSYTGGQADALRHVATSRARLPEAARSIE